MDYLNILLLALFGSILSLIGGFILISNDRLANKVAAVSAPFAAGALIAAALVDLLPEAFHQGTADPHILGFWMMIGMALFFLLERQLGWFHHHHDHKSDKSHPHQRMPVMLVIGDTIHNAIDGAAIAIAYLADPSLGIITTFAVAMHEIPQEIGDFSLLLKAGWSKKRVIAVSLLSASSTIVAALLVFTLGQSLESSLPFALALTAGVLLYVAASDVIPGVHSIKSRGLLKDSVSFLFLAGMGIVSLGVFVAHKLTT